MGLLNLTAFNLRALGDLLTVITIAKRGGVKKVDELEALIQDAIERSLSNTGKTKDQVKHEHAKKKQWERKMPNVRCSVCSQYMKLLPVNDSPETMVGEGYKSCGVCYNPKCMHVDYYLITVKEKAKEVGLTDN